MMPRWSLTSIVVVAMLSTAAGTMHGQQDPQTAPVFRSTVDLVLVDVVVRDRKGALVSGLKADDFQVLEDGRPQQVRTFAFEEISSTARPIARATALAAAPAAGAAAPSAAVPLTSEDAAGHRLLTLLFDTSSMQPEDVQKAADAAVKWVDREMSPADLVAVASIGSSLQILSDFSGDKERVHAALQAFSAADGTAFAAVDASTDRDRRSGRGPDERFDVGRRERAGARHVQQ